MKGVKNLRVITASLCLSTTLLTGCGNNNNSNNEIDFGGNNKRISINYENEIPIGTISYEDLNKYIKIVTLEYGDINTNHLLIRDQSKYSGGARYGFDSTIIKYIDLETGTNIIEYQEYSYSSDKKEKNWIVGENLTIIEEQDITGYLLQEDFIKKEYTVEEILTFFVGKIKPNLEISEKELVK